MEYTRGEQLHIELMFIITRVIFYQFIRTLQTAGTTLSFRRINTGALTSRELVDTKIIEHETLCRKGKSK